MNMELSVAPTYVIHDIQFPSNVDDASKARLELTITTSSVQFDDGAIFSGFSNFGLQLLVDRDDGFVPEA